MVDMKPHEMRMLYEPPLVVNDSRPHVPGDLAQCVGALAAAGKTRAVVMNDGSNRGRDQAGGSRTIIAL